MKPNAPTGTRRRSRQALLIDDDPLMLAVLGDMLRERGFGPIVTAANGTAGVTAFDRCSPAPDLVVCDLHMPGNDGFQFMEQLGDRHFAGGVLLVSGMDARTLNSASLMARFHRLNILAALTKPVDEGALAGALAKLA